ncbi:MAG: phosphatase PAP2 family protein [Pseudobutyrivibrio sp.]|nr:phosphatase PAP2 family protein [Pseudobutyrivibrio sp.]
MAFSYKDINNKVKRNNGLVSALNVVDKAITYITVLFYVLLLVYGIYQGVETKDFTLLYRSILIPGISFALVSYYRKRTNSPRPYQVYDFTPALNKDTLGKSFPSRHVFSIFMVAIAVGQVTTLGMIIIFIMGIMLATIRVLGGVHFIKDVVAGMLIALIIGAITYGLFCGTLGLLVIPFN